MDLKLVALRIELHAIVTIEVRFLKITKSVTLMNRKLWFYQSETINKEIFNINDAEPDNTPPDFSFYAKAVGHICYGLCMAINNNGSESSQV